MISKLAWNAFKNTGDINIFLEFAKTRDIEENLLEEENGDSKNKGTYFKRK